MDLKAIQNLRDARAAGSEGSSPVEVLLCVTVLGSYSTLAAMVSSTIWKREFRYPTMRKGTKIGSRSPIDRPLRRALLEGIIIFTPTIILYMGVSDDLAKWLLGCVFSAVFRVFMPGHEGDGGITSDQYYSNFTSWTTDNIIQWYNINYDTVNNNINNNGHLTHRFNPITVATQHTVPLEKFTPIFATPSIDTEGLSIFVNSFFTNINEFKNILIKNIGLAYINICLVFADLLFVHNTRDMMEVIVEITSALLVVLPGLMGILWFSYRKRRPVSLSRSSSSFESIEEEEEEGSDNDNSDNDDECEDSNINNNNNKNVRIANGRQKHVSLPIRVFCALEQLICGGRVEIENTFNEISSSPSSPLSPYNEDNNNKDKCKKEEEKKTKMKGDRKDDGNKAGIETSPSSYDNNNNNNNNIPSTSCGFVGKDGFSSPSSWRSEFTSFRGSVMIATCLSIISVDFFFYPKRFMKTEEYGLSLMDMGVTGFVMNSGIGAGGGIRDKIYQRIKPANIKAFSNVVMGRTSVLLEKKRERVGVGCSSSSPTDKDVKGNRCNGSTDAPNNNNNNINNTTTSKLPKTNNNNKNHSLFSLCHFKLWFSQLPALDIEIFYTSAQRQHLLKSSIPVVLIGVIRVAVLVLSGLNQHITEYGKHWNFYITTALVSLTYVAAKLLFKLLFRCVFAVLAVPMRRVRRFRVFVLDYLTVPCNDDISFRTAQWRYGVMDVIGLTSKGGKKKNNNNIIKRSAWVPSQKWMDITQLNDARNEDSNEDNTFNNLITNNDNKPNIETWTQRRQIPHYFLSLFIITLHQTILSAGASNIIFYGHRDNIIAANKEGIGSLLGYVAIFSFGIDIGKAVVDCRGNRQMRFRTLRKVFDRCLMAYFLLVWFVEPPSRRLCNASFIVFSMAVMIVNWIFASCVPNTNGVRPTTLLTESINYNQLAVFCYLNLIIGAFNLSTNSIFLSFPTVIGVLVMYSLVFIIFPYYAYRDNVVLLKFT